MKNFFIYLLVSQIIIYLRKINTCDINHVKGSQINVAQWCNITTKIVNSKKCVECDGENRTEFPCCNSAIISNLEIFYTTMILLVILFFIQMTLIICCAFYICVRDSMKSIRGDRTNDQTHAVRISLY